MGFTTITDPNTGRVGSVDFRTWLSVTWADIVAHPDPEQRRRHRAAGTGVDYAEGLTKTVLVERVEQTTGRVRLRRTRKRRLLFAHGRGFACVNDGSAFASELARHLAAIPGQPAQPQVTESTCSVG